MLFHERLLLKRLCEYIVQQLLVLQLTQHWPRQTGVVDPKKVEQLKEQVEREQGIWMEEYVRRQAFIVYSNLSGWKNM